MAIEQPGSEIAIKRNIGAALAVRMALAALCILLFLSVPFPVEARAFDELKTGYFTVKEEGTNRVILRTGRMVTQGDRFLDADNKLYEVVRVGGGNIAWAKFQRKVDIAKHAEEFKAARAKELQALAAAGKIDLANPERRVAIYHTHSDESYIPTDGAASVEPRGGVYNVGAAAAGNLKGFGVTTDHSYAVHLPHDGAAYDRSRRTAMQLLRSRPDAILDVHRDAAPLEEYATTVNGKPGARLMIVVGRQNPNMKSNEQFAFSVKDYADRNYPGLIKGIFYGDSTFNQDLSPRALLLEVGSQENSRYAAERGAATAIDALPAILYGAIEPGKPASPAGIRERTTRAAREGTGALRSLGWIVAIAIILGVAFLLVNEKTFKAMRARISRLWNLEFANLLGAPKQSKDGGQNEAMVMLGDGGQPQVDDGVYVRPTPITAGSEVIVEYSGLLARSGADSVYLHMGFGTADSWDQTRDIPMTRVEDGKWVSTIVIDPEETSRFNFCFHDSAYNWDNNSGINWSYEIHNGELV